MDLRAIARVLRYGWVAPCLAAFLASLAFVPFPRQPFLLDDSLSEKAVLSSAHEQGWHYGKDIVFTYGPWGYLVSRHYFPHQHGVQIVVLTCLSFFTALGACLLAWRIRLFWRILFVTLFVYLTANIDPRADLVLYLAILCWGWLCLITSGIRLLFCAFCFALAAVFGVMVKANFLFVAIFSAGVLMTDNLLKRRRGIAAGLVLGLSAMFATAWLLSGQRLGDLPAFFANAWSIIEGYDQTVGLDAPSTFGRRGIIVAVLAMGAVVTRVLGVGPWTEAVPISRVRWRTAAIMLWLLFFIFVVWKHGFVRADLYHMGFFFGFIPILVMSLELLPCASQRAQVCSQALTLSCCLLTVLTLNALFFSSFKSSLAQPFAGLRENVNALLWPLEYQSRERKQYQQAQKAARLPGLSQVIGQASVDVFGQHQCYATFNNLNYHCRPVFQSYLAFNQRLTRLNEQYYLSPVAPRFVLFELDAGDHRFPPLEDARLLRHLLLNFRPVLVEKPFLLLQSNSRSPAKLNLLQENVADLDERLRLPQVTEGLLWVEILLEPNWWGRFKQIFIKPATIRLTFWQKDIKTPLTRSQAPPPMLASGFVASPLLLKTHDVEQFLKESHSTRPFAFSLELSPEAKRCWKPSFRFKIYSVEKGTETKTETNAPPEPLAWSCKGAASVVQCALASLHP